MGVILPLADLALFGQEQHARGARIVFTNGHFDLLHIGHVRYLQAARGCGDLLVVGVNDDPSTAARKGAFRPIIPADERAEILAALACVDAVVVFAGLTADQPITLLMPAVYVKGGDYALTDDEERAGKRRLPEAPLVRAYGGTVVTVPLVPGQSTTAIERTILRAHGCAEMKETDGEGD
ncbi:MAG: adenylyltransferase/cytidyltransferase family protein [Thermomicrobia bacterium]|nr:adenylyltransferase/cytidyltransferase family protein [Thermomicrobia bacterium]